MFSAILDIRKILERQGEVVDWLKHHYRRGALIATICSGTFILAETGLLDGNTAATHRGFADLFRKRWPEVNLRPERVITDEGDLF